MSDAVPDEPPLALLRLLAAEDGLSAAKARKRLALSDSELRRVLSALGNDPACAGLDLVTTSADDGRQRLWLTPRGRSLVGSAREAGVQLLPGVRIDADGPMPTLDQIADETPVALLYNGVPFAVMLASPCDLEDFALGFALGEGIVDRAADYRLVDCQQGEDGIALHGHIPQACFDRLETRRRSLSGRSGCGLCGMESLRAVLAPLPPIESTLTVSAAQIRTGFAEMIEQQRLNRLSGGVHAAGFVHRDGVIVREDIGRHNAVDKLIGALARQPRGEGFLTVTSRASYEIVHKAARAGIALVAAISAPTTLAIRLAHATGITLVAFARGETMTIYTGEARIAPAD